MRVIASLPSNALGRNDRVALFAIAFTFMLSASTSAATSVSVQRISTGSDDVQSRGATGQYQVSEDFKFAIFSNDGDNVLEGLKSTEARLYWKELESGRVHLVSPPETVLLDEVASRKIIDMGNKEIRDKIDAQRKRTLLRGEPDYAKSSVTGSTGSIVQNIFQFSKLPHRLSADGRVIALVQPLIIAAKAFVDGQENRRDFDMGVNRLVIGRLDGNSPRYDILKLDGDNGDRFIPTVVWGVGNEFVVCDGHYAAPSNEGMVKPFGSPKVSGLYHIDLRTQKISIILEYDKIKSNEEKYVSHDGNTIAFTTGIALSRKDTNN